MKEMESVFGGFLLRLAVKRSEWTDAGASIFYDEDTGFQQEGLDQACSVIKGHRNKDVADNLDHKFQSASALGAVMKDLNGSQLSTNTSGVVLFSHWSKRKSPRSSPLKSWSLLCFLMAFSQLVGLVHSSCYGKSDNCADNPMASRRSNPLNYHQATCNLKWKECSGQDGTVQKPPAYNLCTSTGGPSGQVATDWYTFALQNNNFSSSPLDFTLHGLWPGSYLGQGARDQPYGCENGAEFDEEFMISFGDLFATYWPTDPKYHNTPPCFVMSEWMKHGTCAVIKGQDGTAYRIPQEDYYRAAIVLTNEYNLNDQFRQRLIGATSSNGVTISVDCVECAYFAAIGWRGFTAASVPRMPSCVDQCISCTSASVCSPAHLGSTVEQDNTNAPQPESVQPLPMPSTLAAVPLVVHHENMFELSAGGMVAETAQPGLEGGVWRSYGAEQLGSGKFEFAQVFSHDQYTSTTDSPYPNSCNFKSYVAHDTPVTDRMALFNCGANKHSEDCLVKRLPDIGGLDVAFFACNHSGFPAPLDFNAAMDTKGCGNFLMFRCKRSSAHCNFTSVSLPPAAPTTPPVTPTVAEVAHPVRPHPYQPGLGGAPAALLGSWRALEVTDNYDFGMIRWNITVNGQASQEFPNYPARGIHRFAVTHSTDGHVYLTAKTGSITSCLFEFKYHPVYSYAVLACGAANAPAPSSIVDSFKQPNKQWAMGRCNACSGDCFYSCDQSNNNCGHGSCDPARQPPQALKSKDAKPRKTTQTKWTPPNWCKPGEASCWPTLSHITALEEKLGISDERLGLRWKLFETQPGPVPSASFDSRPMYGLGQHGLKPLYHYKNIDDIHKPCFSGIPSESDKYQNATDICKASVRNNEYQNWNPFIVVFPLHERHIRHALEFAVTHRLCIAIAGTGHEYLGRQSCPTGGIMIRPTLLKDKTFLPTWKEDPAIAPQGAFKFGSGIIFTEIHNFSAQYHRVVASGWCSTVGMPGYHLGGGHGPFAPSMGLGVDNVLEIEVLQIGQDQHGKAVIHKKTISRKRDPQLFWAMRGGGGGVWGVILSMTLRAHAIPNGGLTNVYMEQSGTFCQDHRVYGYEWVRSMWSKFAAWNLMLNQKVSTQPGFFIDTTQYTPEKGLCSVTWKFTFEYFYAGGKDEPDYIHFRDQLKDVLGVRKANETTYANAYEYVMSMPPNKFMLGNFNPLPKPHGPSDNATGSQNSVFVSREAMKTGFALTMMKVLDICVQSVLAKPTGGDPTSPAANGTRCGFHYLYTSVTGNLGSEQPQDTAVSPGFRSALMLWNARTLTTQQMDDTLYSIGHNSYFSESSYVMHDWISHYWGDSAYEQLLAIKKAHDPGNHFWCHHCVGDNPDDFDGTVTLTATPQHMIDA